MADCPPQDNRDGSIFAASTHGVDLAWDAWGVSWVYNYSHTPAIYFLDIAQRF